MNNQSFSGNTVTVTSCATPVQPLNIVERLTKEALEREAKENAEDLAEIRKMLDEINKCPITPVDDPLPELSPCKTSTERLKRESPTDTFEEDNYTASSDKPLGETLKTPIEAKNRPVMMEWFEGVKGIKRWKHVPRSFKVILSYGLHNSIVQRNNNQYDEWYSSNPEPLDKDSDEHKKWNNTKQTLKAELFTAFTPACTSRKHESLIDKEGNTKHIGTGRIDDILELSGIAVVDFDDDMDLTGTRTPEEIRQGLKNDQFTYRLFDSPSGGIKVFIRHNCTNINEWHYFMHELLEYYIHYHALRIDINGKDPSRMCYLPHIDPDELYENDSSKTFQFKGTFLPDKDYSRTENIDNNDGFSKPIAQSKNDAYNAIVDQKQAEITDELYDECQNMSMFLRDHNINITEGYGEWVEQGFSLCFFGNSGREIYHNISSVSTKYDIDKCNKQFDDLLTRYDNDRSGISKFLMVAKQEINKYVNKQIRNEVTLPSLEMYNKLPKTLLIPLRKYNNVTKFIGLLAGIGNVSGILPNLRVIHNNTNEYESNLFVWIGGKSGIGKNAINDARKNFSKITDKINEDNYNAKKEYEKKKAEANARSETFIEREPKTKTLYIGADLNKPTLARELKKNDCRAIISSTEADTLVISNKSTTGAFTDILRACFEHECYQKNLVDYNIVLEETYLSMILASTPDTIYDFFNGVNVENGMYSRFLAFLINTKNPIERIKTSPFRENYIAENDSNKINFLNIWQDCLNLKEYPDDKVNKKVYLNLTDDMDEALFTTYEKLQKEVMYIYKFCNPDAVIRIWIMHKRLILLLSALYHFEKSGRIIYDDLVNGLDVDPRALDIAETIMKIYRDSFVQIGFCTEKFKHKKMLPYLQNHLIRKMKLEGYSEQYLSILFDLPVKMINGESSDENKQEIQEIKSWCLD
jgi:hypothetical protein